MVLRLDLGETTWKPALERVLQRMKNIAEGRVYTYYPSLVCSSCPRPFMAANSLIAFGNSRFCKSSAELPQCEMVVYLFFSFENEIT